MTDNVVKAGIEDVLSSVKRLVSEEARREPGSDPKAAARKPGRLVLTDALRIGKSQKGDSAPLKLEPEYSAEKSAKPMLLRTCDIVRAGTPANRDEKGQAPAENPAKESATAASQDNPTVSLSAKIEALEAAIARTEDQWEPDGDSDDAYSGTPVQSLPWNAEKGFAAEKPELQDEPESFVFVKEAEAAATFVRNPTVTAHEPERVEPETSEPELAEPQGAETESLPMDEDALRELIADVVRQELQGALGERITRNVRKMVRREIHRALAAQDLE